MIREIRVLRRHGIDVPIIAYQEARRAGLELAVLAAVLEQETGGGRNVFGHDEANGQIIWHGDPGTVPVTKSKYLAYRRWRDLRGRPPYGRMQGVGPMQLTWYAYQDEADRLGGAWKPRINVRVGATILAENMRDRLEDGQVPALALWNTLRAYNGSRRYADEVTKRVRTWRKRLYVEPRQGWDSLDESLWRAYSIGRRRGFTDLGTYAGKPGSHGLRPAFAFDLGDPLRFKFLGWGYLKARRLANFYVRGNRVLGLRYVILGSRIWHCRGRKWEPYSDDGSHRFHIHANGHDPTLTPCPPASRDV